MPPRPEPSFEPRRARADDVAALVALEAGSFATDRLTRRGFRHLVASPTAACLVGETGGELAGYALVLFRRNAGVARLYSLAVAPTWRGRGIAGRLMEAAEDAARERGARWLRLEMREDDAAAAALYRARGYRACGHCPDYYADHAGAVRLQKDLGQ